MTDNLDDNPYAQFLPRDESAVSPNDPAPSAPPVAPEVVKPGVMTVPLDNDPTIAGAQAQKHADDGQAQSDATNDSHAAVVRNWGVMTPDERTASIDDKKSSADYWTSFWQGINDHVIPSLQDVDAGYKNLVDGTPDAAYQPGSDGVIDYLSNKVQANIAENKRSQFIADQMKQGLEEPPTLSAARNDTEVFLRDYLGAGTGDIVSGTGRLGEIIADKTFGPLPDDDGSPLDQGPKGPDTYADIVSQTMQTLKRGNGAFSTMSELATRIPAIAARHLGNWIYQKGQQYFPGDPARADEFMTQFSSGVGTMAAFMGPSMAISFLSKAGPATMAAVTRLGSQEAADAALKARAIKIGMLTSGGLGAPMQAESVAQDAEEAQGKGGKKADGTPISKRDVQNAFLWNLPVGATEALPMEHLLESWITNPLRATLIQGMIEGGQEWGQQWLENLVAQQYYDPDRKWDEGNWESGAIGWLLGVGTEVGTHLHEKGSEKAKEVREARLRSKGVVNDIEPQAAAPEAEAPQSPGVAVPAAVQPKRGEPLPSSLKPALAWPEEEKNPVATEDEDLAAMAGMTQGQPAEQDLRWAQAENDPELADFKDLVGTEVPGVEETGTPNYVERLTAALNGDVEPAKEAVKTETKAETGTEAKPQDGEETQATTEPTEATEVADKTADNSEPRAPLAERLGDLSKAQLQDVYRDVVGMEPGRASKSEMTRKLLARDVENKRFDNKITAAHLEAGKMGNDVHDAIDRATNAPERATQASPTEAVGTATAGENAGLGSPAATLGGAVAATPEMHHRFRDILRSDLPSKKWAGDLGASPQQLKQLIKAAIGQGLLRKGRNDTVRRTPQAKEGGRPLAPAPIGYLVTPDGKVSLPVRTEVVELSSLKPQTKKGALQPRDRTTTASQKDIERRAENLDPARLMPRQISGGGAPVALDDGTIIDGNGRVLAMQHAYPEGMAEDYREAVGPAGDGLKQPVIIQRVIGTPSLETLKQFAVSSNPKGQAVHEIGSPEDLRTREAKAREFMRSPDWIGSTISGGEDTSQQPGFMTPDWKKNRIYRAEDGSEIHGYDAAVAHLGASLEAKVDGGLAFDKQADIVIGYPGAGKGTVSAAISREKRSAHITCDDAKLLIPEYDGGHNSGGVHEESSRLAADVVAHFANRDANIIYEKVGSSDSSLVAPLMALRSLGYHTGLVYVDVPKAVAMERAISRFKRIGRGTASSYYDALKVGEIYNILKQEGAADETSKIDWNERGEQGWRPAELGTSLRNLSVANRKFGEPGLGQSGAGHGALGQPGVGEPSGGPGPVSGAGQSGEGQAGAGSLTISPDLRVERQIRQREEAGHPFPDFLSDYAHRLEAARGDHVAFAPVMAEIRTDKRVKKAEALELAHVVGLAPNSRTTKTQALASIEERHAPLRQQRDIARQRSVEDADARLDRLSRSPALLGDLPVVALGTSGRQMASLTGYHGSPNEIAAFDQGQTAARQKIAPGTSIATNPRVAQYYQTRSGQDGHIYQVAIDADTKDFLDWDAPLGTQGELGAKVAAVIAKTTGMSQEEALALKSDRMLGFLGQGEPNFKAAAAEQLTKMGAAGILYRGDQAGPGVNYVVFDPAKIAITHRDGSPVTAQEHAQQMAALMGQNNAQNQARLAPATLTPHAQQMAPEIVSSIEDELRRALPANIGVRVADQLFLGNHPAAGITDFQKQVVEVALSYGEGVARETSKHEIIHALRGDAGQRWLKSLFDHEEWQTLLERTQKTLVGRDIRAQGEAALPIYREIYGQQTSNQTYIQEALDQELVAKMAETWVDGATYGTAIDKLLYRIQEFFDAVARALHSVGIHVPTDIFGTETDSIFRRTFNGEVAKRAEQIAQDPFRSDFSPAAMAAVTTYHGSPNDWAPEKIVRLPDGSQQTVPFGAALPPGAKLIRALPAGRPRFDKTRDGAHQAFGPGFYSAQNIGVAKNYKEHPGSTKSIVKLDGVNASEPGDEHTKKIEKLQAETDKLYGKVREGTQFAREIEDIVNPYGNRDRRDEEGLAPYLRRYVKEFSVYKNHYGNDPHGLALTAAQMLERFPSREAAIEAFMQQMANTEKEIKSGKLSRQEKDNYRYGLNETARMIGILKDEQEAKGTPWQDLIKKAADYDKATKLWEKRHEELSKLREIENPRFKSGWLRSGGAHELEGYESLDAMRKSSVRFGDGGEAALNELQKLQDSGRLTWEKLPQLPRGGIYTLKLNVDDRDLIDWDKPLAEQSKGIYEKLRSVFPGQLPARASPLSWLSPSTWFWRLLHPGREIPKSPSGLFTKTFGSAANEQSELRQALAKAGIPGIRFLDGFSRKEGEGGHNYVMFDPDSSVEVTHKEGTPVNEIERNLIVKQSQAEYGDHQDQRFAASLLSHGQGSDALERQIADPAQPGEDMSEGARRERAQSLGFDFDTPYYHGTGATFDAFSREFLGKNFDFGGTGQGFFFTTKKPMAEQFAKGSQGHVIDARLKLQNPFVVNVDAALKREVEKVFQYAGSIQGYLHKFITSVSDKLALFEPEFEHMAQVAMKKGYDSVIVDFGDTSPYGKFVIVPDPSQIRDHRAAFNPGQADSAHLMASLSGEHPEAAKTVAQIHQTLQEQGATPDQIQSGMSQYLDENDLPEGLAPKLEGTAATQVRTPEKSQSVQALSGIIENLKSALGMTATQGRYGLSVTDRSNGVQNNRPEKTWRFKPQQNLRGQYANRVGAARYKLATDIDAIAHEGGHHLETMLGAPLAQLKRQHADELRAYAYRSFTPAAQNGPAPSLNAGPGYSGVNLDSEAQRLLVEAIAADGQAVSSGTPPAKSRDQRLRAELEYRLGGNTADEVFLDAYRHAQAQRALTDLPQYVQSRFSETGMPAAPAQDQRATLSEGFAEFFREYMLHPEQAKTFAPDFYNDFEDLLDAHAPQLLQNIERAQLVTTSKAYDDYLKATTLDRARADLVSEADQSWTAKLKQTQVLKDIGQGSTISGAAYRRFSALMSQVYSRLIDDKHPWYLATRQLLGQADQNQITDDQGRAVSLAVHQNPYKLIRSISDSFKTGLRWIQDGVPNYREQGGPRSASLHDALTLVMGHKWNLATYQDIGVYLESRRAVEEHKAWNLKRQTMAQHAGKVTIATAQNKVLNEELAKAEAKLERRGRAKTGNDAVMKEFDRGMQGMITEEGHLVRDLREGQVATPGMSEAQESRVKARLTEVRQKINAYDERRQDFVVRRNNVNADTMLLQSRVEQLNSAIAKREAIIERSRGAVQQLRAGGLQRDPHRIGQAEHEARIAELEKLHPNLPQAAKMIYDFVWQSAVHDFQAGRLTKAELDYRATRRHFYVPFARDLSDIISPRGPIGGNTSGTKKFAKDKTFEGSDRAIVNPLETIIDQTFHRAAATHFNDAMKAFIKVADTAGPGAADIAERVEQSQILDADKSGFNDVQKRLVSLGYAPEDAKEMVKRIESDFGDTQLLLKWAPESMGPQRPLLLPLWENGERKLIRLNDPEWSGLVYNSVNAIGKDLSGLLIDAVAAPATALRLGVTINPTFVLKNIIRDMASAWILTGNILDPRTYPLVTQARGLYHEIRQTDMARAYQEVAGLMGGQNVAALSKVRDKSDVMALKEKGMHLNPLRMTVATAIGSAAGFAVGGPAGGLFGAIMGSGFSNGPKHFFETLAHFSDMSETATRLGTFTQAYKAALSYNPSLTPYQASQEAAYVARDLIDFGRRGSNMLIAARLVPFLNANVQGLDKAVRAFLARSDRGNQVGVGKITAAGGAGALAGYMAGGAMLGTAGAFAVPAAAVVLASRSEAARRLLAPMFKRVSGLPQSADDERLLGESAKAWVNLLIYSAILAAMGAASGGGDPDEYKQINDRIKNKAQPVKLGGEWYQVPKAFEFSVPGNIMGAAIDAQTDGDPRFWDRVLGNLSDNIAPPGMPQTFRLLSDLRSNYNSNSGNPIVPDWQKNLPPNEQFNAYTSQIALLMAHAINGTGVLPEVAPLAIDYALTTGLGYWGKDIQKASNAERPLGPKTGRIEEYPIIGTILQSISVDPNRAADSLDTYYNAMSKDTNNYQRAAQGYDVNLQNYGQGAANAYLATLDDDHRAYALLMGSNDQAAKRAHPLNRLQNVLGAVRSMEQDLLLGRLADTSNKMDPQAITLSPSNAAEVRDTLAKIKALESWNTLVDLKIGQYANRHGIDIKPTMELLASQNKAVAEELQRRYDRKHVMDLEESNDVWTETKADLLKTWADLAPTNEAMPNPKKRREQKLPMMRLGGPTAAEFAPQSAAPVSPPVQVPAPLAPDTPAAPPAPDMGMAAPTIPDAATLPQAPDQQTDWRQKLM